MFLNAVAFHPSFCVISLAIVALQIAILISQEGGIFMKRLYFAVHVVLYPWIICSVKVGTDLAKARKVMETAIEKDSVSGKIGTGYFVSAKRCLFTCSCCFSDVLLQSSLIQVCSLFNRTTLLLLLYAVVFCYTLPVFDACQNLQFNCACLFCIFALTG